MRQAKRVARAVFTHVRPNCPCRLRPREDAFGQGAAPGVATSRRREGGSGRPVRGNARLHDTSVDRARSPGPDSPHSWRGHSAEELLGDSGKRPLAPKRTGRTHPCQHLTPVWSVVLRRLRSSFPTTIVGLCRSGPPSPTQPLANLPRGTAAAPGRERNTHGRAWLPRAQTDPDDGRLQLVRRVDAGPIRGAAGSERVLLRASTAPAGS